MSDDLAGRLVEQMSEFEVIDAHEHLPPESERTSRPVDVLSLFSHYTQTDLRSAGMSEADCARLQDAEAPLPERWAFIDAVPKTFRGDYINVSLDVDLTMSALDNGLLTDTRFGGALRALEQSWGRYPATMIPDVRFTPNPNNAPGGPLVERGQ